MAEIEYDAFRGDNSESGGIIPQAINFIGALTSIALIAGLFVWGYQLTIRDVSEVPVIRALEGPARVQPANPGGELAEHSGLAVNSVQSDGRVEGPAQEIILAPDPIDLTAEDIAAPETPETVALPSAEEAPDELVEEALRQAEAIAEGEEPLSPITDVTDARAPFMIPSEGLDPAAPGIKKSARPNQKPRIVPISAQSAEVETAIDAVLVSLQDAGKPSIPPGTRLVQLGAYDDVETAEAEWNKIAAAFQDYFDGKERVILEAKSGGRTFYRLRAMGFDDLNASRRFCAVLVAANSACIPVLSK